VLHEESEFRLSAGAAGQRLREDEHQNDQPEEKPNEESPTREPGTHCQATPHTFESVLSAWKVTLTQGCFVGPQPFENRQTAALPR
jgi:hypothetical protein